MCAKAAPKMAPKLAQSLRESSMGSIGMAAKNGATTLASLWIDRLDPEQALLVLAMGHVSSTRDWEAFEQACRGAGGELGRELGTRDLKAMMGEAARPGSTASKEGFVSIYQKEELAKPHYGSADANTWERAMKRLASRASMALAGSGAGAVSLSDWLSARLDPKLVAVALPQRALSLDFSELDGQQVVAALIQLHKSGDVDALARAGSLAAQRLWDLNQKLESLGLDRHRQGGIDEAALVLWRSQDARGFEAFLMKLSDLAGSSGIAAGLCGIPTPALHYDGGFKEPGCAGQVIALLRVVGSDAKDANGALIWSQKSKRSDPLAALLSKSEDAAHLALLDAGAFEAWDYEVPKPIGARSSWSGLNLAREPWAKTTSPERAVEAWESAFEAMEHLRMELGQVQEQRLAYGVPPKPGIEKGSPSARNAWNIFAIGQAKLAADWLCEQWMGSQAQCEIADKLCASLNKDVRKAIIKSMPEAFEVQMASWSKKGSQRVIASCQAAARALGEDGPSIPSVQETLCAAFMCASAYGLSKSNDHEKSGYYGSRDNRTGSRLSEQAKELDGYLAKACEVLSMSQWEEWGPFGKKELCAKGFWGALCMKSIARDVEASGWEKDWDDAGLSEKSAHAQASLRGLFEIPPSEHDSDERCLQLLATAKKCLDKAGVDGWRRLPGEHSVLEMAVEARAIPNGLMVRADRGCFGVGVVKKLVEMGACPSDDQAPKGRDALALCALVERKYSSSSVMKALLSSPMGNPSKGELVSILAKGESTLSGKLVDELSAKAVGNPSMDTLVRLGLCCPDAKAVLWLGNALKSKEGEKLAPDLLGELGRARADAKSCAAVSMCMSQRGLVMSVESQRAMDRCALGELLKSDTWDFAENMGNWIKAGASKVQMSLEDLPGQLAQSCLRAGMRDSASLPQAALAMALDYWSGEKPTGGLGARVLSVVCSLPQEWMGADEVGSVGWFMSEIESRGKAEALRTALVEADIAKLESWALSAVACTARQKKARQSL
jgi:hypothetical protein